MERNAVKKINVNNKGITTLEGIEHFPKLEKLYCSKNNLTSLDVSKNAVLMYLNCKNNQLTGLNVESTNIDIEIVLNVPLDEFEEFKRHAASAGRGKNQKNKSQNPQKVGRCTSNAGIVVLDKTAGETISIVPKNAAHAILRC